VKPRRYQLNKQAVVVARAGHPWIFRDQLSSAASVFADGDWLRLHAGDNTIVGYGIYEASGAVAIRILRRGADRPDAAWVRNRLIAALARRRELAATTDGIRLLHGESDGIPAVVADRFGDSIVVASYSAGADALALYVARLFASRDLDARLPRPDLALSAIDIRAIVGPARNVVLRPGRRRASSAMPVRVIRGTAVDVARFVEDGVDYAVDLAGHKTGAYLDLRGLRHAIRGAGASPSTTTEPSTTSTTPGPSTSTELSTTAGPSTTTVGTSTTVARTSTSARADASSRADTSPPSARADDSPALPSLAAARVLDLFSYTGMLALSAELAGARDILSVDASTPALELAKQFHVRDPSRHRFVTADVFDWLPALDAAEQFDLVLVDPPAMTSRKSQVRGVLAAYTRLYRAAAKHVQPGGAIVAACCTSRIERGVFRDTVRAALGDGFHLERELRPEPDHPVRFAQSDYLKITIWRRSK
jgi:23S rRNA G2069 N7-methylase RlmK/C1962 C5-methylase RlmI